jgi:lipid-A-disaccharide synthase
MSAGRIDLLVVAGEASGDLYAARLIEELRRLVPEAATFGLGGDGLRAAGLEPVADSAEISVVGLFEVLRVLPRARQIFRALVAAVERRRPRLAVLVDFPEFNLRLARQLKARGVPVVYYISPQVWAWRRGRVKSIARLVDRMLVLFPFEADFYRGHGLDVVHVGHPLVDEVPALAQAWEREPDGPRPYRLALLPGSRASEVEALLPVLLAAAARLARDLPVAIRLIRAPTVPAQLFDEAVALSGLPVEIVEADRFAAVADSHLALCASGTATLEVGLLGTPQIVVYRLARWTYLLGRLLVRLPDISLVNLVLGRRVVPELIQAAANPRRIAAEAARLLTDRPARDAMRGALAGLRGALGRSGASRRAASAVAELLGREAAA